MKSKFRKSENTGWRRRKRIMGTKLDHALSTIRSALECQEHLDVAIVNTNPDGSFAAGDNAQVICCQCVKRLQDTLDNNQFSHYPWKR